MHGESLRGGPKPFQVESSKTQKRREGRNQEEEKENEENSLGMVGNLVRSSESPPPSFPLIDVSVDLWALPSPLSRPRWALI